MARWVRDEVLNQPADFVDFLMNDYLMKNGFKQTERKGEQAVSYTHLIPAARD